MTVSTIFFDLDDTIYPPTSGIWQAIAQRIDQYIHEKIHIAWEDVPALRKSLFTQYGTTMRGLQAIYHIDPDDYLSYVHDIPVEDLLKPDPALRTLLLNLPMRKIIFTNADTRHAKRVLTVLGIYDCFEKIIDIVAITPYCKPQPEAFQIALNLISEPNGSRCVLIDDSIANLIAAKSFGFYTIYIGNHFKLENHPIDASINYIHEISKVLPK